MRYTTTVLTEFDQELFDECSVDLDNNLDCAFIENLKGGSSTLNSSTSKEILASDWKNKLQKNNFISFKIIDNNTNNVLAYTLGTFMKPTSNMQHYVFHYILYKINEINDRECVDEFWKNSCCSENKTSKECWSRYLITSSNTSSLASMLRQKHNIDNISMTICVPRYASFETNYNEQQ
jgi:hypothetical protein